MDLQEFLKDKNTGNWEDLLQFETICDRWKNGPANPTILQK